MIEKENIANIKTEEEKDRDLHKRNIRKEDKAGKTHQENDP